MSILKKHQVVDWHESKLAQGYTNMDMVGELVCPRLVVSKRFGKYMTFGKESMKQYDTKRGIGGEVKMINFETTLADYSIPHTHHLAAPIDDEEDEQTVGVSQLNLVQQNRLIIQQSLSIEREREIAALFTNSANYTDATPVATNWTTYATADIFADVLNAKETVRQNTGMYPTKMIVSAKTFNSMRRNEKLLEYYKYTTKGVLTKELIAAALEVDELVVGAGVYDDNGTITDIWGTSFAALIVAPKPQGGVIDPTRVQPSFAYTLQLMNYPKVKLFRDEYINSDVVKVEDAWVVKQVGAGAGTIFTGTLA